jgi:hypothetical protein
MASDIPTNNQKRPGKVIFAKSMANLGRVFRTRIRITRLTSAGPKRGNSFSEEMRRRHFTGLTILPA